MKTNILYFIIFTLLFSGCARVERKIITINTEPEGALITISELDPISQQTSDKQIGISPVDFEFEFNKKEKSGKEFGKDKDLGEDQQYKTMINGPEYTVTAQKEGYFNESRNLQEIYDEVIETGKLDIAMSVSPLWEATEISNATNEWTYLIVAKDISATDMWQRVVDAVTRRFQELKEYDFNSGYLTSIPKIKKFKTIRGTFLLRTKFLATVMERDPLTYRLKIESDWSDVEGKIWNSYPRVFKEDAELVKELMQRFQAY